MTRDRSILNARLTTNLTLADIGEVIGITAASVLNAEKAALKRAWGDQRPGEEQI